MALPPCLGAAWVDPAPPKRSTHPGTPPHPQHPLPPTPAAPTGEAGLAEAAVGVGTLHARQGAGGVAGLAVALVDVPLAAGTRVAGGAGAAVTPHPVQAGPVVEAFGCSGAGQGGTVVLVDLAEDTCGDGDVVGGDTHTTHTPGPMPPWGGGH